MDAWDSVEKQLVDVKNHSWTSLLQYYGALRSVFYTLEVMPLSLLRQEIRKSLRLPKDEDLQKLKQIVSEVWMLIQQDSERMAAGIYPATVLRPEVSFSHLRQLLNIWIGGYQAMAQEPDLEDLEALRDIPGHYRQQYNERGRRILDPSAASLYEHQMELLYLGAMDAMRRLILAPMKKAFRFSEGEGLRFLEIGCGTGRMTKLVKLAFPKAKIVVLDASPAYLSEAQRYLSEYSRIDFIQGDAIDLPFKDNRFDVVFASFLLHEVPLDVRRKILGEAYRVLASKGWLGVVDLLQYDDCRELNWALEQPWFIGDRPHAKDYTRNSLVGLLQRLGLTQVGFDRGFLGKAVYGIKGSID